MKKKRKKEQLKEQKERKREKKKWDAGWKKRERKKRAEMGPVKEKEKGESDGLGFTGLEEKKVEDDE